MRALLGRCRRRLKRSETMPRTHLQRALRVSCDKCGRSGRYQVQRLIRDRGRDGKIVDCLDQIIADCTTQLE